MGERTWGQRQETQISQAGHHPDAWTWRCLLGPLLAKVWVGGVGAGVGGVEAIDIRLFWTVSWALTGAGGELGSPLSLPCLHSKAAALFTYYFFFVISFTLGFVRKSRWLKNWYGYFPGGPVVKNPPSNAGDTGLILGQGTKIPPSAGQLSSGTTTTEPTRSSARAPQLERSLATKTLCKQINKQINNIFLKWYIYFKKITVLNNLYSHFF